MSIHEILFVFNNGYLKNEENTIFNQIRKIAFSSNNQEKLHLVKNISKSQKIDKDIILKLSYDQINIAHDILINSPLLNDEDLINVINDTKDIQRIRAISQRVQISNKLLDVLKSTNDKSVLNNLSNLIFEIERSTESGIKLAFSKLHFFTTELSDIINTNEFQEIKKSIENLKTISYALMLRYLSKGDILTFFILLGKKVNMPISSLRNTFRQPNKNLEASKILHDAEFPEKYIEIILFFFSVLIYNYSEITENNFKNYFSRKLSTSNIKNREIGYFIRLICN